MQRSQGQTSVWQLLQKAKAARLAYDEDALERKLVQVQELVDKEKSLKKTDQGRCRCLHLATKAAIEGLTDKQVFDLLDAKWIQPLMASPQHTGQHYS